jgi:hypothetical protein
MFNPSGIASKIVSEVDGKELNGDSRPEKSMSGVTLHLGLVSESGNVITISSANKLKLCFDPYNQGYGDFGNQPITLQQYKPNDPNAFYPVYDIRKVIANNGGEIPLPNLDGSFDSGQTYAHFVLSFNRFLADLNDSGKVGLEDFAYFAADWNATDVNSVADISGPNGLPDKNVDAYDLSLFARDWLKDINDPNTW